MLWGWANTTVVSVSLDGKLLGTAVPNTTARGRWDFALPAEAHSEASAGHTIELRAGTYTRTLTNIAFGDVYLCSGQRSARNRTCGRVRTRSGVGGGEDVARLSHLRAPAPAPHARAPTATWSTA